MYTCTKRFENYPAAHRQHNHKGHCALIHGHNWTFDITFRSKDLDENLFVVDFGKLGMVKQWLESTFDHTLLLNHDDPYLRLLCCLEQDRNDLVSFANIVVVPNCGAEALAAHVMTQVQELLNENPEWVSRGLVVSQVTVFEDSKNSATFTLS